MNTESTLPRRRSSLGYELERVGLYAACGFLSLAVLCYVTELWKADLSVLLTYYVGGDLFWTASVIKGFLENGSYLSNPQLGAPFGLQTYDFPTSEAFYFLMLKLLNIATGNYAVTMNIYYICSYPLTAMSALWTFRRFNIGATPAVICSVLYAFLIAHFGRGMHHLTLAGYYLVPFVFWVVLTIGIPDGGVPSAGLKELLKSRWFLGRLAVCVAIGSDGFYYSFFAMFFLACAGLFAWAVQKCRHAFQASCILVAAILLTSLCNVVPSILYWAQEGPNPAAVVRVAMGAEIYGLKITHLTLPSFDHRAPFLAKLGRSYLEQSGGNEASTTSGLGLIGALGFVFLLTCSLFRRRRASREDPLQLLGMLNLMGVLLATVGGFGSLLSLLGLTQIRAYNRISVFLAFLAFMAVALLWQNLERALPAGSRALFIGVSVLVAGFALWDEIPATVAPNYSLSTSLWQNDARYVALLESSIAPGSAIFQLPYIPFPEYPPVLQMTDYSHFRPYLHSRHLRWSYGAIKGRNGAAWMEATSALPAPQMVKAVADIGYVGIYIDRYGYSDHAAALESELSSLLGTTPLVSEDNRLCYYALGALARKGTGPHAAMPGLAFPGVQAKWEGEFSALERKGAENWRWCGNAGVLRLINKSKDTAWIRVSATVKTAWPEDAKVEVRSALFADELVTNATGLEWQRLLGVPPGEHRIAFTSNARKHAASGTRDPRNLVFALHSFLLTRAEAPAGGVVPKPLMLRPLETTWGAGTYTEETGQIGSWHWCSAACEIGVMNPSTMPAQIRMTMGVSTGHDKPARLTVKGPGILDSVPASSGAKQLAYTVELKPGKSVFRFSCDAPRVLAPGDPRTMVFMIRNFALSRKSADSQ